MEYETYNSIGDKELRQAQKCMMYIMKRIHAVCVEHNIKYWLDYGTLLGAIRHDGFIPWDDDMDICMMREDYEKFCKIAPEALGEEFFWQNRETDPLFFNEFGRVRLNGTLWLQQHWSNINLKSHGIFVDIFPLDPFPSAPWKVKFLEKIRNAILMISKGKLYARYSPSFVKRIIAKLLNILIAKKMLYLLWNRFIKSLNRYKATSNKKIVSMICMDTLRNCCEREIFDTLVLKKFEDTEFFIPARYDERLKKLFKDYMTPPPEAERRGHHGIIKIDFGKYKNL